MTQETIDKIKDEAKSTLTRASHDLKYSAGYFDGYYMGATEWAGKAEGLIEFIEYVINFPPAMSKSAMSEWVDKVREDGATALAKYKEVAK